MKIKAINWSIIMFIIAITLMSFKRVIYKRSKTYIYEAYYLKPNGDTLTKEIIKLHPLGRPWIFQFSQTAYEVEYNTIGDSLLNWINPINRRQNFREVLKEKAVTDSIPYIEHWSKIDRSGAVENKEEVWTHPFRSNQYVYTEIAPFPEINRQKLYKDSTWESGLILGWDNWNGKIYYEYKVLGKKDYYYQSVSLKNCWEINASGKHSNPDLGVNWTHFLFHPNNGFVELNYTFYNGVKIDFKLIKILNKKKK